MTALLLALGLSTTVAADVVELHANARFDQDIAGVTVHAPAGGNARWSPTDLSGGTASGSLMLDGPPGNYTLVLCLRPEAALPFGRWMFDFSMRTQGSAPATVLAENIFAFGGDDPVHDGPCEGPWTAYLRYVGQAPVAAPARIGSSIPTYPFPLLHVIVQVAKPDAGPLYIDDWSVSVDTDVVFRDDETATQAFSL